MTTVERWSQVPEAQRDAWRAAFIASASVLRGERAAAHAPSAKYTELILRLASARPFEMLVAKDGSFPLAFRLLDKDRKPLKAAIKSELKAAVTLAEPSSYVVEGERKTTVARDLARVTFGFGPPKSTDKDMKPLPVETPAKLRLSFPRYGNDPKLFIRDSLSSLTLSAETPAPTLSALLGGYGATLLAHVAVDGVERAFVYKVAPTATGDKQFTKLNDSAARVFPAAGEVAVTKPMTAFPVRVEVDNAKAGDQLELHVRRRGATDSETEVIKLGGPREERMWVEPRLDTGA